MDLFFLSESHLNYFMTFQSAICKISSIQSIIYCETVKTLYFYVLKLFEFFFRTKSITHIETFHGKLNVIDI